MGEKRAASFLGVGIGGVLVILGLMTVLASFVDIPGLVTLSGGALSAEGRRAAQDSGVLALWLGVAAVAVGVLLFVGGVAASRREPTA